MHLDCVFASPREGLAMMHLDGIEDGLKGLPKFMHDWEFIEANEEEAFWLGVNGLPLNPETYLIDSAHQRIIKELRAHGMEVIEIPDGPSYLGGSLRCSSQPLVRAD